MQFVYLDLGNVLVRFEHRVACEKMAAVAGLHPQRVWDVVYQGGLAQRYEKGELSSRAFYGVFCRETSTAPPFDEFYYASADMFQPNRGMESLVRSVRQTGQRMGILSNTCESHWDYCLAKFPWIAKEIPLQVLSFQVGSLKPEPEIYRVAAERAETDPGEIFFTDDRPENVWAAREAGFDAELFHDFRLLEIQLISRGTPLWSEEDNRWWYVKHQPGN
jgi:glucose-1-phosphatase